MRTEAIMSAIWLCATASAADIQANPPEYTEAVLNYAKSLRGLNFIKFTQVNCQFNPGSMSYVDGGNHQTWQIRRRKVDAQASTLATKQEFDTRVDQFLKNSRGEMECVRTEVSNSDAVYILEKDEGILHIYKNSSNKESCVSMRNRTSDTTVICAPLFPMLRDDETVQNGSMLRFTTLLRDYPTKDVIRGQIVDSGVYKEPDQGSFDPQMVGRQYWSVKYPIFKAAHTDAKPVIQVFTKFIDGAPVIDRFSGVRGGIITYGKFKVEKDGRDVLLANGIASSVVGDKIDYISYVSDVIVDIEISDAVFAIDPAEAKNIFDHATSMSVEP